MTNVRLTGNTRYRSSFFGKLILQVEEKYNRNSRTYVLESRWRDATLEDLFELNRKG